MRKHALSMRNAAGTLLLALASSAALTVIPLAFTAASLEAQSPPTQATPSQAPTPQWQIDACGKMEFDVISVKPNKAGLPPSGPMPYSNIPLGPQDMFAPTGGLLTATNMPLFQYMVFAYKLTPDQLSSVRSQLPKWATTENFDVQARASGNPTKDQFRLMMQALLADRFKLAIHYETRELPILVMTLDKPGKLGPKLQQHPEDSPCSTAPPAPNAAPTTPATVDGGFPEICGALVGWPVSGRVRVGARNVPMAMLASSFSVPFTGVDRPILDKTGLHGKVDFLLEFTPQINGPLPPGTNFQPDDSGPTFLEALKEQLGLKLDAQKGPVAVIVIDHVEQPSEN